jgi:hypothetical protein
VGAGRGSPAAEGGSHVRAESEVGEGGHHIVARASRQASEEHGRPASAGVRLDIRALAVPKAKRTNKKGIFLGTEQIDF